MNTIKEKRMEILYRRRDFIDKIRIDLSNSFDKYLLTFATGTLYLSITFTNSLNGKLINKYLLMNGWILLLVSVISALASIGFSILAHNRQIEITDGELTNVINNEEIIFKNNYLNNPVILFQIISPLCFIVGISLLTFFYFQNL